MSDAVRAHLIRYETSIEKPEADEVETIVALSKQLRSIQDQTLERFPPDLSRGGFPRAC